MLDIGIHPGYDGMNGLPFLDDVELDQIDLLLVTHFHLDHAASLPYLTERTNFKGRIFMTHPTKAVLRLLLGDYLRLLQMNGGDQDALYNEADLKACMEKIELVDYHSTVSLGGMTFYALNAGHVLGACMFFIEFVGGKSVLYTGDYSLEEDRHLMAAEIPNKSPDLLIVESTYGVQVHASRAEREARFTGTIERIVTRGGRCLIPVFALGRAQELLLILDEYWQANPTLQNIPIWYASKLASRALRVYQTYANMMNSRIRAQMNVSNPFRFNFINNLKSIDVNSFDDSGPCVVFASPGMLQSGVSRQLFDRWASDPKNGVMIAGYAVEHTLAKEIMAQPKEVVTLEGRRQALNCLVDYVSFSAHVDFVQNRSFITQVSPKHIILVHGQKDEMGRLKSALLQYYKQVPENKRPTITMPPNQIEVKLMFPRRRSAKVMGDLATKIPRAGDRVRGILVTQDFHSKLVAPQDLATYTPLRVGSIASKLHVPFSGSMETLKLFLNEMFAGVREQEAVGTGGEKGTLFTLHGDEVGSIFCFDSVEKNQCFSRCVMFIFKQVKLTTGLHQGSVTVEWDASPAGDAVADAVVALIMQAQSSAASIRLTSQPCRRYSGDEQPFQNKKQKKDDLVESRLRLFHNLLKEQFKSVDAVFEGASAQFEIVKDTGLQSSGILEEDGKVHLSVRVEFLDPTASDAKITIESKDEKLATNIQAMLQDAVIQAAPVKTKAA